MSKNPRNNYRVWGDCSTLCAPISSAYELHSVASNPVMLFFKHWLVYIDVMCPVHGAQRWCIEKNFDEAFDLNRTLQILQGGAICISCSSYGRIDELEKTRTLDRSYNLNDIFSYVFSTESSEYNVLLDNCKLFKNRLWDGLYKNVKPVYYAIKFRR